MDFDGQKILPAIRRMKDFEKLLQYDSFDYLVLLETHLAWLHDMVRLARRSGKKVLLHADLVQGLKNDEHAAEYICQVIRPEGIISTRSNVLSIVKKRGLITVQRLFLLDSIAVETSYRQFEKIRPDFIEVLPGIVPKMIREVHQTTGTPIIAGGLIRSEDEIKQALNAGATAISTSLPELWKP
ncbi:glycerol-3-phosphate responsive antiterminator [Geobacillus thermocatenulatus]|uniref:glycerol-3-phosphate responsive antiterminator n=1 Tax=Geobacillus thermocatenulatus TaxID=33938 RepID=UPI00051965A8|nr:glycerol-3-phosphate responsive antiterminator [Geobacillus thermocatenulatus]